MMVYLLDLFGVAVFAVTGALAAGEKKMDLFGVVVLALATALGGGTLRDVILGSYPVFWISDPTYIFVGTAVAATMFTMARFVRPPARALKFADAVGLAVFTVIGTEKALLLRVPASIAVIMGIMTGVAGGIIRDILSGEIPLVLKAEIYATASLCGAITFAILTRHFPAMPLPAPAAITVILAIRLAAIHWKLSLPVFPSDRVNVSIGHNIKQVVKAGALYFALVFGAGFALGPIRILWLVPRVGTRLAELIEMPIMLGVVVFAARWGVRKFAVPQRPADRLGMGCIALLLLLVAEFGLVLRLRGLSMKEYFATIDPVSGTAFLLIQGIFAAMPLIVGRTMKENRS